MKKSIFGLIGLVGAAPLAIFALTRMQTPAPPDSAKPTFTPTQNPKFEVQNAALAQADNEFGVKLLQILAKQDSKSNIVISPASLAVALQMTYNGANGDTAKAMAQAMGVKNLSLEAVNQSNAMLLERFAAPAAGVELCVANSLWTRPNLTPRPDFVQRNQTYYGAALGDLSGGTDSVNAWISKQTNGKIPTIVDADTARNSAAILANAVYFKGTWNEAFEEADTKTAKFTPEGGAAQDVPMMRQSKMYRYAENASCQSVSLPYGEGTAEMTILLPRPGVKFADFVAKLTPASFPAKAPFRDGNIELPRFKSEYSAGMNAPLSALGMGLAFDQQKADFSKMFSGGRFYIAAVLNKTYLDVNEKGTEAAAATGIAMKSAAIVARRDPFTMIMNRPFAFAIRDAESGAILFVGAIAHIA